MYIYNSDNVVLSYKVTGEINTSFATNGVLTFPSLNSGTSERLTSIVFYQGYLYVSGYTDDLQFILLKIK